ELEKISKEYKKTKEIVDAFLYSEKIEKDIKQAEEMLNQEDEEMKEMAEIELSELNDKYEKIKKNLTLLLVPEDPKDNKNVIMEVRAGVGGDEAEIFAGELLRMYLMYANKKKYKVEIISKTDTPMGGVKESILSVIGDGAYADFKYESGVHRVQRVPETEKQGRVHTSAASVVVMPEAEETDIEIDQNDVRIDTFCAGGKGGQCVNTTYSAVRLTHIPTGIVVSCQDERSQAQNKIKAFTVLRSRILAQEEEKKAQEEKELRQGQIGSGDRSEKIRTYNFPQDRLTDHRIKYTTHGLDKIMNGEIDELIANLKMEISNMKLKQI
ncbi:peptide chain release factor 1, partial [bacterium]|nr:peptide chain release factor 1 [bacterium]